MIVYNILLKNLLFLILFYALSIPITLQYTTEKKGGCLMKVVHTKDTMSPIYLDAVRIRNQVFVVEQGVPFEREIDQDEARLYPFRPLYRCTGGARYCSFTATRKWPDKSPTYGNPC